MFFGIRDRTIDSIEPIRISEHQTRNYTIDLLLVTEGMNSHYVLITKLANLVAKQYRI